MNEMERMINHRDNYSVDCSFCAYRNIDRCDGCSVENSDHCCSCHINPPCSYCENSGFEPSPFLINYEYHNKIQGKIKIRWECFAGTKEVFDKLKLIEKNGLKLSAETLSTGEIAMYIDDGVEVGDNDSIEICVKGNFKAVMSGMILGWEDPNERL